MRGELRGQVVQRDGAAEEAVGERLRALERAVGERQAARMLGGEMRRAELDHLAGADEEHALLGDRWDRCAARAPPRRTAIDTVAAPISVSERTVFATEKVRWNSLFSSSPSVPAAWAVRTACLNWPEDLRLAQHHRIEPARHAEGVLHRLLLRQLVEIGLDLLRLQAVVAGHPVHRRARLLGVAIDLGAVAGRDDRRLLHRAAVHQVAQRPDQALGVKHHLLAHRQRGGLVVDAESEELHGCAGSSGR